jgi:hypothetical protein
MLKLLPDYPSASQASGVASGTAVGATVAAGGVVGGRGAQATIRSNATKRLSGARVRIVDLHCQVSTTSAPTGSLAPV